MLVEEDRADHPAVAAAQEASQEAAAPTVPPAWEEEGEVAVEALEDQGATPPYAALAPDPPESHSHPHASPSLFTTTTPRALRGPTDQQVCGHPAAHSPLSPSHLISIQTAQQMESLWPQRSLR